MLSSKDIPDETVDYHRSNGWIDAIHFLDYDIDYSEYWHRVSIGPLLPAVYRAGNIDMIGRDGIRPELRIPGPASPQSHPRSYNAYAAVTPTRGDNCEWYYTVMGFDGCDRYIPISSVDDTCVAELQPNIVELSTNMSNNNDRNRKVDHGVTGDSSIPALNLHHYRHSMSFQSPPGPLGAGTSSKAPMMMASGLNPDVELAVEWSPDEQAILEDDLFKYYYFLSY
ncbi:hypothetical protein IFM89_024699 [Coptis chinensis]|uniref:Uncharacterized protein n=1 Tax=Coptis chinensis TaxID=261450 RepID=A0A835LGC7_9MAGN|nr:hypothetical protein IFM89_024699 [Coptis chinensis]